MLGGSSHALLALTNVANYGRRDKPCVVAVAPRVRSFRRFASSAAVDSIIDQSTLLPVVAHLQPILRDTYTTALTTMWHIVSVCDVCSGLLFLKTAGDIRT